jgi:hypothetical protein
MVASSRFVCGSFVSLLVLACCACSSSSAGPGAAPPSGTSANLIVNGDAETAAGSMDGTPVATPGWTVTGEATAIQYGASGGYPASTDPGPPNRGMNFFAGGEDDMMSSLAQTVDVTQYASAIDGGAVTYSLSGWLGGYSDQGDNATLTITFEDATGTALGTATIGPVLATDRNDTTELLERDATGAVPKTTRTLQVTLSMVRTDGAANDGYADDLSFILDGV